MSARNRYASYVLIVHAVVAGAFGLCLLVIAGRSSEWFDWIPFDPTMAKMFGASLFALGVGSALASRDPLKNRVIVQMEIVYTALAAIVSLYRLLRFGETTPDFAWVIFVVYVVFFVLFSVTYPRAEADSPGDAGKDASPADA